MQRQDFENDFGLLGPLIAIPETECPFFRTTSRSVGNARSAVSNDLAELLVQDDYIKKLRERIKKLRERYFRLWRNAWRLIRMVATGSAVVNLCRHLCRRHYCQTCYAPAEECFFF